MKPTDLFSGLSDFQAYTDGLVADTTYGQLSPSIRTVVLSVIPLITAGAYVALAGESEDDNIREGKELLKTAVAAGSMLKYQIFSSVKKNGSDAALYKYQHEEIKESYSEAYWLAMDRLLDFLDEHPDIGGYDQTAEYAERQKLPVRSGSEFDRYYGIGGSAFFYHKVLFIVRQVWRSDIRPALPETTTDEMMELAKEALCHKVVAQAVMQFDVTELPRSIRWDFNHEYTKGTSMQNRTTLYNQLTSRFASIMASIERMKAVASGATSVGSGSSAEDDKIYTIL